MHSPSVSELKKIRPSVRPRRIGELRKAGVSIWLDALSRDMLESGELAEMIAQLGVSGITSNPATFAAAMLHSSAYDTQLRRLARGQSEPRELFLELALEDVQQAARLLRACYERSDRRDGLVSFECTPDVAHDSDATIAQATALWRRIAQPNAMIKVPATDAGLVAIEELTAEGVNVNVTLLFSLERYEQVIEAYLLGLERLAQRDAPLDCITSVASLFVSRVDAHLQDRLSDSPLRGQVAVANARAGYALHRQRFSGERWQRLQRYGARVQRPLWASTATKDPELPDTHYVDELICEGSVITLPPATLRAFAQHGHPERWGITLEQAETVLAEVADMGIEMEKVGHELEVAGLDAFSGSYRQLLEHVSNQARSLR